jgi:hypothetical protein
MPVGISLMLVFLGLALAIGGWRLIVELERGRSAWVYIVTPILIPLVIWCFYAAYWMLANR